MEFYKIELFMILFFADCANITYNDIIIFSGNYDYFLEYEIEKKKPIYNL